MRLTTKGRFAVTAMVDLAMRQNRGPVTLAAISERQHISLSYLEQLFGKLRRARLVRRVVACPARWAAQPRPGLLGGPHVMQNPSANLIFILFLFAILYFLMWRPQQRRIRAMQALQSSL